MRCYRDLKLVAVQPGLAEKQASMKNKQAKFAKKNYPSSLIRVTSNRPTAVCSLAPIPSFAAVNQNFCATLYLLCCQQETRWCLRGMLCSGAQAVLTYAQEREFFSVSFFKRGASVQLQRHALQEGLGDSRHSIMSVHAHKEPFCTSLILDAWQLSHPASCVFLGRNGCDKSRTLMGQRPNFFATCSEADCSAFAAFQPIMALQEDN